MMKPKRITCQQYDDIRKALMHKAKSLTPEDGVLTAWYSMAAVPCVYHCILFQLPKRFRDCDKMDVRKLEHFLPFPCDCEQAMMQSGEETICLAVKFNVARFELEYYLTTHRIGCCPHKEVRMSRKQNKKR